MGGVLNFSFCKDESWGPTMQVGPLRDFFFQRLDEKVFLDIERIKLNLTWTNKRVGEDCVSKRVIK
jgi:hypothetical protein